MKKVLLSIISGIIAFNFSNFDMANATTRSITPKAPKITESLKPIVVKYKKGDYIGSMQDLEELVKKEKNNTYAKYYLALCYTRLGYKEEAKILYQEVIDKDENLSLSHYSQKALDCLEEPNSDMCRPASMRNQDDEAEELPSDIDLFIMSGRKIHPD